MEPEAESWISFLVTPSGWIFTVRHMNSSEGFTAWMGIRGALAVKAFRNRDVFVITESPQPTSWAREVIRLQDPECVELEDGRITLLVIRMNDCQPEVLAEAGTDEDFWRGLMWFSPPVVDMRQQAVEILHSRISAGLEEELLCEVGYEVMSCEGDGRQVVWCSPGLEFEPFVRWFRNRCAREGFRVAIDIRA